MKIKEVHAGIKLTKNYNSYQASLTAELASGEDPEKVGTELMEKASAIVKKNIGIELDTNKPQSDVTSVPATNNQELEVGAAWPDKTFPNKLSVKDSKTGHWKDINLADLEKTSTGYKQKTSEGIFLFRKLSESERPNDKMPAYRIYKSEES